MIWTIPGILQVDRILDGNIKPDMLTAEHAIRAVLRTFGLLYRGRGRLRWIGHVADRTRERSGSFRQRLLTAKLRREYPSLGICSNVGHDDLDARSDGNRPEPSEVIDRTFREQLSRNVAGVGELRSVPDQDIAHDPIGRILQEHEPIDIHGLIANVTNPDSLFRAHACIALQSNDARLAKNLPSTRE